VVGEIRCVGEENLTGDGLARVFTVAPILAATKRIPGAPARR
jgi:hypothetical protein